MDDHWSVTLPPKCNVYAHTWGFTLFFRREFWNFQPLFWAGRQNQNGVMSVRRLQSFKCPLRWCIDCKNPSCKSKDMIFWNNKLWISVSRQLMTSSWRNNFCIIYWLLSTCVQSFNLMRVSHLCFFLRTIDSEKNKKNQKKKRKKKRTKTMSCSGCCPNT